MAGFAKRLLLLVAVAALFSIGHLETATAQLTVNSFSDIVIPGNGQAEAYYNPVTGEVVFATGEDLSIVGVSGVEDADIVFGNFDSTTALGAGNSEGGEIAFFELPPPFGSF